MDFAKSLLEKDLVRQSNNPDTYLFLYQLQYNCIQKQQGVFRANDRMLFIISNTVIIVLYQIS